MKNIFKRICCLVTVVSVLCLCFMINASAAATTTIAFSSNNIKVGDTVTVTVKLNAGEAIYGLNCSVNYNTAVLKYESGAHTASGSQLQIVDSPSGETTKSYSLKFTAIAEGSSNIKATMAYSGASLVEISGISASATLTVKNPTVASSKPSTSSNKNNTSSKKPTVSANANLASLTVEGGTLSPAFSKNTTDYTVTVENQISSVNIKASTSDRYAKVTGTGAVELQEGENPCAVTVTASDGKTQKKYNINIKRLTIDETVALNPLAIVIDGQMHNIEADISAIPAPLGFTASTATYNGKEIGVFKSDTADYTLFRIVRKADGVADYFIYKELRDEFVPLQYMTVGGNMYIFADLPEEYSVPEGYYETAVTLGNGTVKAFCSNDEALANFYTLYCYGGGKEQFFRFDMTETSIQRAPDFDITPVYDTSVTPGDNFLDRFTKTEKILGLAVAVCVIIIISLIIALAASAKKRAPRGTHAAGGFITDDDMADFFTTLNSTENSRPSDAEE